jgi:MurNAc alpha-1-phosphate uridylyltransferase
MKAMILAAGRGERMRPLTDETPKPLLMLAGKPLIVHTLLRCKTAGITDVVINLCYRGEQIKEALQDGSQWGMHIQYSREEQLLGMAGGIVHALPLLGDEAFLVMSADVVTDYPFANLVKSASTVSHAHVVMVKHPPYHLYHLNEQGLLALEGEPKLDYAGFGVFHPTLFRDLPAGPREIPSVLEPYILNQNISGEIFDGEWHNLGTPAQYHALCTNMAAPL